MAENAGTTYELKRRKRVGWRLFGFLVLAAIIAHGIWALQTRAAWHREVARLKAAGEWVTPDDIPRLTITGPNFADPVLAAIRLIDEKSIDDATWRHEFIDPYRRLPLLPGAKNVLSICVDQNENALAVFDQARARKEVDWGHQYKSPLVEHYSPELREIRNVADVIASDSILCFDDGRDDRAIDRCEQLLQLADRMRVEPMPLYWFYAGGIEQLATENLMECAPEIEIGFGAGQVSRDRIESLIAYLVDESLLQQSFEQALRVQRVGEIDALQTWLKGCVRSNDGEMKIPKLARYPLLPLRYRDQLLVSRATDELLMYSRYENAPQVDRSLKSSTTEASIRTTKHPMAILAHSWPDVLFRRNFDLRAHRRLAATSLAIRLYRSDHHGQLPQNLEDLVPNYLPNVPSDPFAESRAIQFVSSETDPRLYSVDRDMIDDQGTQDCIDVSRKGTDLVAYLKLQPPRARD